MADETKKAVKAAPKKSTAKKAAPKAEAAEAKVEKKAAKKVAAPSNRLLAKYRNEVIPELVKEFGYTSIMQAPRLEKIVINIGVGDATANAKALDDAVADLTTIAGQKPVVTKAKKSIAGPRRTSHRVQGHPPGRSDVRIPR